MLSQMLAKAFEYMFIGALLTGLAHWVFPHVIQPELRGVLEAVLAKITMAMP